MKPWYETLFENYGTQYDQESFTQGTQGECDVLTLRDYNTTSFTDDDGNSSELECNERYYMPSEITWLLNSLGFKRVEIFGAKLGAYSRNDRLTDEDFEMLVIAER